MSEHAHSAGPPCPACDEPTARIEPHAVRRVKMLYAVRQEDGRYEVIDEDEREGRPLGQRIWCCTREDCDVEIWELLAS